MEEGKGKGRKRRRSSLSSDGGEDVTATDPDDDADEDSSSEQQKTASTGLGSLHKRRVDASPEKFDKGRFEPFPLKTGGKDGHPLAKKARVGSKLEITYDSNGTPRVSSFPSNIQDEGSDQQNQDQSQSVRARMKDLLLATDTTSTSNASSTSTPSHGNERISSVLLNASGAPPNSAQRTTFSLLHAICRDNSLLLHFVSYLSIPSLISLYAISKPFHYLFNRHPTAFILSCMRTWAPNADTIYPWRCYQSLCVKDPAKRQKKRLEGREAEVNNKWDDLRDVPSLRWLQMVVWREGVSKDILIQLAVCGLRCPPGTLDAIKRMWFLLDLPLNAHRIALIHNPTYITSHTLHNLTCLFLKLDMHFTDPIGPIHPSNHPDQYRYPNKHARGAVSGVPLRKMLLAERQLTPLWRVLRGWNWDPSQPRLPMTRLDLLRLWIRHKFVLPNNTPEHVRKQSIMDIPWYEVGIAGLERTGVAFYNLSASSSSSTTAQTGDNDTARSKDKQLAILHPSILGSSSALSAHQASQLLRQHELLYPHRKRIILAHEKPREPLLRPDELVLKESVRRRLRMHRKWVAMMLYGFCDDGGWNLPVWREEELLRMQKGLAPRPVKGKEKEVVKDEGKVALDGKGEEGSSSWTKLPPKVAG